MESLTDEQRAKIDARILAGEILTALRLIMAECGVGLAVAQGVLRARYRRLRAERSAEFAVSEAEYRSGYAACAFDAISRDL